MFQALLRSSSGGSIVLLQPLVSSLSVNGCTIRWCSQPAYCTAIYREYDTRCCSDTIYPPEEERSTARNMLRIIV